MGLVALTLIVACSRPPVAAPTDSAGDTPAQPGFASPGVTSQNSVTATATPLTGASVTVTDARYGTLAATTAAGATCSAQLSVGFGFYGERPPESLPQLTASSAGIVRWSYARPRVPRQTASYTVTCHKEALTGTAFGSIDIATEPLQATSFSTRVTVEAPPQVPLNPDPSLASLRDAVAAKMKATLATEWRNATRALGGLTVVEESSDITIYVVAAKGTSVHRLYEPDGSQDIIVYVSDRFGPQSVENSIATALHELGHIWCCYGPGTQDGHWLTKDRSPNLFGVDKYGLMTDPVTCVTFATVISCPNRFSDREMTALGFATFPPPVADPCVVQALSLKSALDATNAQLATMKTQLDAQEATLTSVDAQIRAIERQYPGGGYPPSVVVTYNALVAQYNAVLAQNKTSVASYNTLVLQERSQAAQLNALPCDAS